MAIRVIPKPPPSAPNFVSASSGQELTLLSDDITIDIGTGTNRKAFVFLTNQKNSPTFNHTCSYDPTGKNIQITKLDDLDGNTFSLFDSYYYTSLFYYDIPDGDSGVQTFRTTVDTAFRFMTQVVVYENCLSGVPYTSSYESAQTQSAYSPFSYASTSLALDGLSTVVSFGMFERDTTSVTLSPVGIETERNQQNTDTGGIGMDAIVGDFTSSLSSVTTEYTSSFSGSLVSCTAVAIKSPLPRGSSIQSDTQWFFDDFNRANENTITGNWTGSNDVGNLELINNTVRGQTGWSSNPTVAYVTESVINFADDQEAEVVVSDLFINDFIGPAVRLNSNGDGYVIRCDTFNESSRSIFRLDAGVQTNIGLVTILPSVGDKLKIRAVGTTISAYINDELIVSVTDSNHSSGQPGMYYQRTNVGGSYMDNFFAKDVVSGQTGKPFKIS